MTHAFLGGLLMGWGLTQALIHVIYCRRYFWERGDGVILALLLFIAAVGALVWLAL